MRARSIVAILGVALCVGCFGAGGRFSDNRAEILRERVEAYGSNLRWGRVHEAAKLVHPDARVRFVRFMRESQGEVRFTSFEVDHVEFHLADSTGTAVVTFGLYRPRRVEEQTLVESQDWIFDAEQSKWFIKDPAIAAYRGELSSRE